jgi:hypothetical protein
MINFLKRLRDAFSSIAMTVTAELRPIYHDYIGRYFEKKNEYVEYPPTIEIDDSIWQYSFSCPFYNLGLISIAVDTVDKNIDDEKEGEDENYLYDYKNSGNVAIRFKNKEFFEKVYIEFRKLVDINRTILLTEEVSQKNFDLYYSEIFNPKNSQFIKVIPNSNKIEDLIKTLIKYYKDAGYQLNDKIFNDTLFVSDQNKIVFLVFADSEAMAGELSFLILSNNLAEIL